MPDNERLRDKFKRHLLPSRTRLRSTSSASTTAPAPAETEAEAEAEATQAADPGAASQGTVGGPAGRAAPSSHITDQDAAGLATQHDATSSPVAATGSAQDPPSSDAICSDAIAHLERLKAKGNKDAEHALAFVQKLPKPTQSDLTSDIKDVSEYLASAEKDQHDSRSRNYFATAISILNKFVGIGDVAVSYDPVHAALPWAAVRVVITTITASIELRKKTTEFIAIIASLFARCSFYATLYFATAQPTVVPDSGPLARLREAIAVVYTKSLMLLGYLDRTSSKTTTRSQLTSPYTLVNVDLHVQSLCAYAQDMFVARIRDRICRCRLYWWR